MIDWLVMKINFDFSLWFGTLKSRGRRISAVWWVTVTADFLRWRVAWDRWTCGCASNIVASKTEDDSNTAPSWSLSWERGGRSKRPPCPWTTSCGWRVSSFWPSWNRSLRRPWTWTRKSCATSPPPSPNRGRKKRPSRSLVAKRTPSSLSPASTCRWRRCSGQRRRPRPDKPKPRRSTASWKPPRPRLRDKRWPREEIFRSRRGRWDPPRPRWGSWPRVRPRKIVFFVTESGRRRSRPRRLRSALKHPFLRGAWMRGPKRRPLTVHCLNGNGKEKKVYFSDDEKTFLPAFLPLNR